MADRVVIITGAGRGLGNALGRTLGASGWKVVLGARGEGELRDAAAAIEQAGGSAAYRVTDVSALPDVEELVAMARERFGHIDAVIANAGLAVNSAIADGNTDDWNRMIDVNLRGVLHLMAAAVPVFLAQKSGHFITIGSTSATKWVPTQGVYAATKAAAHAATDVLRQELAPEGIRVTFVAPGFMNTGFIDSTADPDERRALRERRDAMAMSPESVAEVVAYVFDQPSSVDIGELTVRPTAQS